MSDDEQSDDEQQMSHMEFLRAQFFSAEPSAVPVPAPRSIKRRARREAMSDIRALKQFTMALQRMKPEVQRANILWLADRFLGIKLS